ncbi:ATP-binding protein [Halocalculus aciditolerans]|uniref:ATPase AAA-type core domain-containing protein n=1 Tax=Halocalculus aciditolerans TaxID=1383812 RepID=A0A830F784_9EURY|nr:ATP-binding protein [Halocalculus aciditolerans]GGL70188.1 hypothetical protein GCM10009039_30280 [Halocalculus aciditolerans]
MSNALRDEGAIYLALGPPGSGKTATAIDVASAWRAKTGGTVITNITSWARADRYAEDSEAARDLMGSIDGPTLLLLDEVAQSISSSGEDSKAVTAMAKFLKYIRKEEDGDDYPKQGSALLIGHTENDTGKDIRRLATGAFQKPSREDPTKVKLLTSEGGTASFTEEASFSGLTDTAETYGEHEASAFRVVTDADDADDDAPSADEAAKAAAKQQAIETALRACQPWNDDDGMNYRDAAALVPYGKSWVGDRVREWQDGDHRDLVDADGN